MAAMLDPKTLDELVAATRLFVTRHEEALLSATPARLVEACDGLHKGLAVTLSAEAGAVHNQVLALGRTPPRTSGQLAPALRRLASGDAFEREAWAFSALGKRMSEAEGALLHLWLTLSKGSVDGPAGVLYARRVAGETTTVQRCIASVLVVLDAWVESVRVALDTAQGRPHPAYAPRLRPARDALRAARECLLSGVPEGAAAPLAHALAVGLSAPLLGEAHATSSVPEAIEAWRRAGLNLPVDAADLLAASEALSHGTRDEILAWRLLDFIESAVNAAGMTDVGDAVRTSTLT